MISQIEIGSKSIKRMNSSLKLLLKVFESIQTGELILALPDGQELSFQGKEFGPTAKMQIHNLRVFDQIIERGDIGLGESYIQGYWSSEVISKVIEVAVLNRETFQSTLMGQWHKIAFYRFKHLLNWNSRSGSKKNISAHYDLGNDFYSLWLDRTMTYSSAYWGEEPGLDLATAQEKKYQLLLDRLNPKPGAHILEIGGGWGGFAEYAVKKGYRVTGITISKEQLEFSRNRLQGLGLEDQAYIRFLDYRDIQGQFDHIVSIEMLEAVGIEFWPIYFKKIKQLLKPGGTAAIQTITISDDVFSSYKKGTDFIQQYIFPGGMLPCEKELNKVIKNEVGTEPSYHRFGLDYAKTLRLWAEQFELQNDKIFKMGYSEEFQKMWKFYLGYCEGAFRARQINVVVLDFKV